MKAVLASRHAFHFADIDWIKFKEAFVNRHIKYTHKL